MSDTQLIRFYRGLTEDSLPSPYNEGSIYVVARDENYGDIYVDIDSTTRLHIAPNIPTMNAQVIGKTLYLKKE